MSGPEVKSPAERLAELKRREAERQAAKEAAKEANELARLELVDRFSTEKGEQGQAWEIVDCTSHGEGFVVVALTDASAGLYKRFSSIPSEKTTTDDVHTFARPHVVYPTQTEFDAMMVRRPAMVMRVGHALLTLLGVRAGEESGKF